MSIFILNLTLCCANAFSGCNADRVTKVTLMLILFRHSNYQKTINRGNWWLTRYSVPASCNDKTSIYLTIIFIDFSWCCTTASHVVLRSMVNLFRFLLLFAAAINAVLNVYTYIQYLCLNVLE